MVMVVADAIFESRRRPRGLDAPDEPSGDHDPQRVIHRLKRDRADLASDDFGHSVGRDVGLPRDGPEHGQSLRGDLDSAFAKELGRIGHAESVSQLLE
jgi:hypothetical protein